MPLRFTTGDELLKLTTYFGERDRGDGVLLADELFALYEREGVALSAMLRGIEGFGHHHSAHTDRLLTLSEDLPVVSVAVTVTLEVPAVVGVPEISPVEELIDSPAGRPLAV